MMNVNINDIVIDKDGTENKITDVTSNSIEVELKAKTKNGITAKNWFTEDLFNRRFKIVG